MLAGKDHWTESRDNLHDQPTPSIIPQTMLVADNEAITKPRHGGYVEILFYIKSLYIDACCHVCAVY